MTPRPIGVLGGMGPAATILFQQRVLAAVAARDDSGHVPLLVDMNPQVPSRIAHLIEGTGRDPGPTLAAMARRLEAAGAAALAMPCNTAHHYAPTIRSAVDIPFLDMIDLTAEALHARAGSDAVAGMLASPATQGAGVFEAAGLTTLWPEDPAPMLAAIRLIKGPPPWDEAERVVTRAARDLTARGADALIVGCSEFSLVADAAHVGSPVIDSLDCLVRKVVAFSFHREDASVE